MDVKFTVRREVFLHGRGPGDKVSVLEGLRQESEGPEVFSSDRKRRNGGTFPYTFVKSRSQCFRQVGKS